MPPTPRTIQPGRRRDSVSNEQNGSRVRHRRYHRTGRPGDRIGPMSHIQRSFVPQPLPPIGRWSEGTGGGRTPLHWIRFWTPRWRGTLTPDWLRRNGLI